MNTTTLKELSLLSAAPKSQVIRDTCSDANILRKYFTHSNTVCLIRQLLPLLIAFQRHRGASMAFLEGSRSFEAKVVTLEDEIATRFLRIKQLNIAHAYLIPQTQWLELEREHDALMMHWREDSVMSNFEFHSHFIDLVIRLMQQLSEPVIAYSTQRVSQNVAWERQLLGKITFADAPHLIEAIAKMRGLVTHASVTGHSDGALRKKVKYLLQSIIQSKEELRSALKQLQKKTINTAPALFSSMLHEHKITQLHHLINDEFLAKEHVTAESHNIFDFVTDIIDLYSAIFEQGINLVQHNIDATFALSPTLQPK